MSANSSVFNYLPIHLRGEIIQIGAVRMNDDWTPGEEFQIDVKPVFFRKMHYKVRKLTGIDAGRLSAACGFQEAFARFREFCGEGAVFLTWGCDDKGIMEQNIIMHDQDWDWIDSWINLQKIYNRQTGGDSNQKSLATAMEHFGIAPTRSAHDALGDAYHTALVCGKLDMAQGLADLHAAEQNGGAEAILHHEEGASAPVEHLRFRGYSSRSAVFGDSALTGALCPECGQPMRRRRWVNQGDRRYVALASCPVHGNYLIRMKLKFTDEETWNVSRMLYVADAGMVNFYRDKSRQQRRKNRRGRHGEPFAPETPYLKTAEGV